jgi:thioredoxin reductase (NADPH)
MSNRPVLLAVDDDAAVLAAVVRDLLDRYGEEYRVVGVGSGSAALRELKALRLRAEPVALILADQRMPGMTGVELLGAASRIEPQARRVLLTAYADTDVAIAAINDASVHQYLQKPWDPPAERLYPVLDALLDAWRSVAAAPVSGVRVVASQWSADAHHIRDFLARNLVPYRWLDIETDDDALALLAAAGHDREPALPLVVLGDGSVLERPTGVELAERIGLATCARSDVYDVVIVGAGPAGLAAAVHASSEGYRTLLLERQAPGGQAGLSARIENYLGFPVGLSGRELARRALAQAKRFGAEIVTPVEAVGLRVEGDYQVVTLSDGQEVASRALLVAAGVQYRRLELPGVEALVGAGVFYGGAVTEAVRMAGRDVHILGAGNAAAQAALHLARFARSVTLLARGDDLQMTMSRYLRDRVDATRNIRVRTRCEVTAASGDRWLRELTLTTVEGRQTVAAFALFVFIGASAQTGWVDGVLQRDARGFIYSGPELMRNGQRPPGWNARRDPFLLETNVPGIFVAGDVRHRLAKGVAAAVGEGNMAAQLIHQHLTTSALRAARQEPVAAGS